MRPGVLLIAVVALVAAAAVAQAQGPGRPTAESFRIEWVRRPPSMRPGVDGYIHNDSRWRVANPRIRAVAADAPATVGTEGAGWVWGNPVPAPRTVFARPCARHGADAHVSR